jgi:WD40 repeat protein/DNA-directed RNA polymerase subunit RPC12/RpoP
MDDIKFKCLNCAQPLAIEADAAGLEISCPRCEIKLIVPAPFPIMSPDNGTAAKTAPTRPATAIVGREPNGEYKYWAFISYSSKDKAWGGWLHSAIETYGIPAELVKRHQTPTGHPAPKRFHPVFRDRDELPASSDLGGVIRKALEASRYLIVICSPNAAQSQWVNHEIETFLNLGRQGRILPIIVDGEPNAGDARECFPPALRTFEPIAADARPEGDGKTNAKLKLLAGMLGVNFDSLKQRDKQRRRQWLLQTAMAAGLLMALAATLIGVAVYQSRLAEQRKGAAEIASQKVEAARQKANAAGQVAGEAAEKADAATQIVRDEKAKGVWSTYAADMIKIRNAWDQMDVPRVAELLDGQRPERTGGVDLRGFEWYYWWNVSHSARVEFVPSKMEAPIGKIAISPDGERLAKSCWDGVKIMDLTNGKVLLAFNKDSGDATCICYSPDGKRIATAGKDHSVKVWDATRGKQLLVLKGHDKGIDSICFSADGSLIAAASKYGNEVRMWDATKGREIRTLKGQVFVETVCFSPDGKRFATGSQNELKVWDAVSGKELLRIDGRVQNICFTPDGKRLVACGAVWDAKTGQKLFEFEGGGEGVSFSPDGMRIAAGGTLWEMASGRLLLALKGGHGQTRFSPDGKRLITASEHGDVKVWDVSLDVASGDKGKPAVGAIACDTTTGKYGVAGTFEFSPDGKRLATVSSAENSDGEYTGEAVKVWDAETGKELITFKAHDDEVDSVRFSPDGKRIATSGEETVKVWDAANGKQLLTLKRETIDNFCFSPDGELLAAANSDNTVAVWDMTSGQKRLTLKGHSEVVTSVCFSPDGKRMATVGDYETVKVWDLASGKNLFSLKGLDSDEDDITFSSVCFSPDGRRMATGCDDKTVRVWDSVSGKDLLTFKGNKGAINRVGFSPDGTLLVASSDDDVPGQAQTLKIWDAASGKALLTLKGGGGSFHFSPDGKQLVSGMTVWDAASGQELLSLQGKDRIVCFKSDGSRLVSGGVASDEKSRKELLTFKKVSNVCLSPDGKRLAGIAGQMMSVWDAKDSDELSLMWQCTTSHEVLDLPDKPDLPVKIWDATLGGAPIALMGYSGDTVSSVCYSPDGNRIATSGKDNLARVWDVASGQALLAFDGHKDPIRSICFSPDGKRLASGSSDGTVKVWDAASGQELLTIKGRIEGYNYNIRSVCFSPDSKRLAVASYEDNTVKVWDAGSGKELLSLEGHKNNVTSVCFSPDGKRLATGSYTEALKVWDAMRGREILTIKGQPTRIKGVGQTFWAEGVCFSPDGKLLARAIHGHGNEVMVWDSMSGKELLSLKGHAYFITGISFSPDGKRLVSGSSDKTMMVWDAVSGQELLTLEGDNAITCISVSPDGKWIATGGGN